jgi:hypothetical protein
MTTHVIASLREKRTEISGQVHDAEAKLAKLRAALANLDAAINILTPDHPDHVPGRRRYLKTAYFSRNELPRLVMDALRIAGEPRTAGEVAASAIKAKGLPDSAREAVTRHVITILGKLTARGTVTKSGTTRNAQWAIDSGR